MQQNTARTNFWPELAMLVGIALLHLNVPVNLAMFFGVPVAIAGSLFALFLVPFFYWTIIRRERLVIDRALILMIGYLTVMCASALFAQDANIAFSYITQYFIEGMAFYFILVNGIRTQVTLQRIAATLLLCGSLLGVLALYQVSTGDYAREFGGLAQRWEEHKGSMRISDRAHGQVGEPNRFAQSLLVLLPIAFMGYWYGATARSRWFNAIAATLIGCAVLISYSRGAFLAVAAMVGVLVLLRTIRLHQVLVPAIAATLAVAILAPGYVDRVATIGRSGGVIAQDAETEDEPVIRGRLTEMMSALYVAVDHPVLGVGPGQYLPFYSLEYQLDPDIALRHISTSRRAHSLYLETAAEMGMIGLTVFLAIVGTLMWQLYCIGRDYVDTHPRYAYMAMALMVGLSGYLVSAIFLHLSYQRYFWMFLGIAGAAVQIFKREVEENYSDSRTVNPLAR